MRGHFDSVSPERVEYYYSSQSSDCCTESKFVEFTVHKALKS